MALKPRVVVVGIGSIGKRHARLLAERDDIVVEWCEPDRQLLGEVVKEMGGPDRIHFDFDAMIASAPSMVVIATPHRFHAEQTIKALGCGAHVLCEKPMAESPESARRMLSAAAASNRVLNIGFHLHFHPGIRRLKELIGSGTLGAIAHVHCRVGSYVTLQNSRTAYQQSLEGALMLDYAHQPDLLYWLLRVAPAGVYATGVHVKGPELHSNPNVLSLDYDYDSPLLGTIHLNYLQSPERHEYEVVGDAGWAVLNVAAATLTIGLREGTRTWVETCAVARDDLYVMEHRAFFDAASGKAAPESPPKDALVSVLMTAAAHASWKSQKRVTLDSV